MTIELTEDEFATLIFALGIATGGMFKEGRRDWAYNFTALVNKICKDRPGFTPYEIPAEPEVTS
jgi:hypothetical protein